MCVVFLCEDDLSLPNAEEITKAYRANSDGAGVAWTGKDGLIYWKKGLDLDGVLKLAQSGEVLAPAMFHFRIATAGGSDKSLTHPFTLDKRVSIALEGKTKAGVLMHNGHWSNYEYAAKNFSYSIPMPDGAWSDSRVMAWIITHRGWNALMFQFDRAGNQKIGMLTQKGITSYGDFTSYKRDKEHTFWASNMSWDYSGSVVWGDEEMVGVGAWRGRTYTKDVSYPSNSPYSKTYVENWQKNTYWSGEKKKFVPWNELTLEEKKEKERWWRMSRKEQKKEAARTKSASTPAQHDSPPPVLFDGKDKCYEHKIFGCLRCGARVDEVIQRIQQELDKEKEQETKQVALAITPEPATSSTSTTQKIKQSDILAALNGEQILELHIDSDTGQVTEVGGEG